MFDRSMFKKKSEKKVLLVQSFNLRATLLALVSLIRIFQFRTKWMLLKLLIKRYKFILN